MIAVFEELANAVAEEKKDDWRAEAKIEVYASWIRKGRLTVQDAADELQISPDEFCELADQYHYSLQAPDEKAKA